MLWVWVRQPLSPCCSGRRTASDSRPIQRAAHAKLVFLGYMSVDHGRLQVGVAEKLLHCANVVAVLNRVSGKAVPKGMHTHRLGEAAGASRLPDMALESIRQDVMPPNGACSWVHGETPGGE